MKLEKGTYYCHKAKAGTTAFATLSGRTLNLSCVVRDWILPRRFVRIDVDDSQNIIFTPSNDASEYSVSVCGGQAKVGVCALLNIVSLEESKRMPCEKLESGAILCRTG